MPDINERIIVTCRDSRNIATPCGTATQVGAGEWNVQAGDTDFNPLRATIAVCWRQGGRVTGECRWDGAQLVPEDAPPIGNNDGIITSPAQLQTLVSCRR